MSTDVAIDVGTDRLRAIRRGRDAMVDEPARVARRVRTGRIEAVGEPALRAVRKGAPGVVLDRVHGGRLADWDAVRGAVRRLLEQAGSSRKTRAIVCTSEVFDDVERWALADAAEAAGCASVLLLPTSLCAAMGVGLDVRETDGALIVDVGASATQAAVVAAGGLVARAVEPVGGLDLDRAIGEVLAARDVLVGERAAEDVKLACASAVPVPGLPSVEVLARDGRTGVQRSVRVAPDEVREACKGTLDRIVHAAVACLSGLSPDLVAALHRTGLHLVGGSAPLPGLADRLREASGLAVHVAERPGGAACRGAGRALSELGVLGRDAVPV